MIYHLDETELMNISPGEIFFYKNFQGLIAISQRAVNGFYLRSIYNLPIFEMHGHSKVVRTGIVLDKNIGRVFEDLDDYYRYCKEVLNGEN